MNQTTNKRQGHAWSIVLAAFLFLLGDKSLLLAQLGLRIYDGETSSKAAAFEISLVGLAIGTAAVVFLSVLYREVAKQDAVAIVTGLVISTLAAFLNIAEVIWLSEPMSHTQIVNQALFFYFLWLLLLLLPFCASMVNTSSLDGHPLNLLATIAMVLVLATFIGALFRMLSGWLLFVTFPNPAAGDREAAFDRLQYEPDMLIMLGATWIAATCLPRAGVTWRLFYIVLAPVCGYAYGHLLDGGDLPRRIAYASLSASAIVPCLLLWPAERWPSPKRLVSMCLLTATTCAGSMFFGFALRQEISTSEKIVQSLLQGLAGGLLVGCALAVFNFSKLRLNWDPFAEAA